MITHRDTIHDERKDYSWDNPNFKSLAFVQSTIRNRSSSSMCSAIMRQAVYGRPILQCLVQNRSVTYSSSCDLSAMFATCLLTSSLV
ncbi:unnamed protein product [Trichogramma brassicae]|uniref:Uncharacterized protein n=1 Tax=Trichogramma brassicae TaxID=86971 RepID=A0A6H5I1N4_9HYME|nr:unnamed protein product [Trichogramma brassicae]